MQGTGRVLRGVLVLVQFEQGKVTSLGSNHTNLGFSYENNVSAEGANKFEYVIHQSDATSHKSLDDIE